MIAVNPYQCHTPQHRAFERLITLKCLDVAGPDDVLLVRDIIDEITIAFGAHFDERAMRERIEYDVRNRLAPYLDEMKGVTNSAIQKVRDALGE